MNLTFHLVRKDLVRMRPWIACWVLLLLTPVAIAVWLLGNNPFTTGSDWHLPDVVFILTGVELFLGYLLAILVIHEDGMVGTRQFWITRPISRGRLLMAKALGILIIVGLVPLLVAVPWWWWCGFGAGQMASAAGEMLVALLLAVLPAAVVAALTDSFARALLWSFAAVALVMCSGFLFKIASPSMATGDSRDLPLLLARGEFAVTSVAIELIALVAALFLVRARGWWLAAAGGLIVMTIVVAARWMPLGTSTEPREHDAGRGASVRVQFERAECGPVPRDGAKETGSMRYQRVTSHFVVTALPHDRSLQGLVARQRWTWPNGTSVERLEPFFSDAGPRSLLGLKIYPDGQDILETKQMDAWLPASVVARMQREPPKFEARLWWEVIRPELQLEVPFKPGRWVTRNGYGVGIERLETRDESGAFNLVMVATRPVLLRPLLRMSGEWYHRFELDYAQSWALLNRDGGRVSYVFGEFNSDKPRYIVVYGVKVEWRMHFWAGAHAGIKGLPVRGPNLAPSISLAVLTMQEDAILSREVQVDRFLPAD